MLTWTTLTTPTTSIMMKVSIHVHKDVSPVLLFWVCVGLGHHLVSGVNITYNIIGTVLIHGVTKTPWLKACPGTIKRLLPNVVFFFDGFRLTQRVTQSTAALGRTVIKCPRFSFTVIFYSSQITLTTMSNHQQIMKLGFLFHDMEEKKDDNDPMMIPNLSNPYSWRRDPDDSLSDWRIVISTKGANLGGDNLRDKETSVKKYHVHKVILGGGPRASQYFFRLFKSTQQVVESKTSTSHIELEASAAAAFPIMLDFIYSIQSTDVDASTDTAVALRYLANYFGVPALFESVTKFIKSDMNKGNIHVYLEEAILYHDENILEATMEVGARAWQSLLVHQECPAYMELLPPSKQLQFIKLVGEEASQLLKKTTQELQETTHELFMTELELGRFHHIPGSPGKYYRVD